MLLLSSSLSLLVLSTIWSSALLYVAYKAACRQFHLMYARSSHKITPWCFLAVSYSCQSTIVLKFVIVTFRRYFLLAADTRSNYSGVAVRDSTRSERTDRYITALHRATSHSSDHYPRWSCSVRTGCRFRFQELVHRPRVSDKTYILTSLTCSKLLML